MKKSIGIVLGLVLIVGAIFFVLSDNKSTLWGGESEFAVRDTAQIVKIFMADKAGGKVLLEREGTGMPWQLNTTMKGHPKVVKMLLTTLRDLEIKYPVSKKGHNSVIKDLASAGIKVEVYTNAYRIALGDLKLLPYLKKERVFYVGSATADNMGTYMIMEGSKNPYVVDIPGFRGFVAARFTTKPEDWLSHEILRIPYTRIASVSVQSLADNSRNYRIQKQTEGYSLTDTYTKKNIQSYDTAALYTYLDGFKDVNFELDLSMKLSPEQVDSIIKNAPPLYEIHIQETLGKSYDIRTFKKERKNSEKDTPTEFSPDRLYALMDGKLMLVQYMTFDRLVRPVEYFYSPQVNRE